MAIRDQGRIETVLAYAIPDEGNIGTAARMPPNIGRHFATAPVAPPPAVAGEALAKRLAIWRGPYPPTSPRHGGGAKKDNAPRAASHYFFSGRPPSFPFCLEADFFASDFDKPPRRPSSLAILFVKKPPSQVLSNPGQCISPLGVNQAL